VLKLLLQVTVLALVFAPLGATKYRDNTGDSYLQSVAMTFLGAMGICLLFAVVAVVWAFLDNRAPLDRVGKRDAG
jgi:hypothetical protein